MDCKLKNIPQVNARFDKLVAELSFNDPQTFKRFSGALVKGAQVVKTKAVASLKRKVRSRGYSRNSIRYGKLETGIRTGKNEGLRTVFVHIMSDFRLKFFEMGTKKRVTKKGYSRGKIEARHFFQPVKDSRRIRELALMAIRKELEKRIKKYLS
jgi:hypothetical protein